MHTKPYDTKTTVAMNTKEQVPGPGHYEQNGIHKLGVYNVSNLRNSLAANWSPTRRFLNDLRHVKNLPGPATYRDVDCMSVKTRKSAGSR